MKIGLGEFFCLIPFKLAQMSLGYVYFAHPNFLSAHTALSLTMIPLVGSAGVKLYSAHANTALALSLPFSSLLIIHHTLTCSFSTLSSFHTAHIMLYRYRLPCTLHLSVILSVIKLLLNMFISKVHPLYDR